MSKAADITQRPFIFGNPRIPGTRVGAAGSVCATRAATGYFTLSSDTSMIMRADK